ncbi:MAG: hypothetical protein IPF99_21725 [Deltaproteobacteria bacterium]|nr:hypothetical protein [Deltaproteobacteria bacterium]
MRAASDLRVDVVETNGQTLIEFLKLQPGTLRLCMEEGTQALWLAEILSPPAWNSSRWST